jgi:hypothetical protein
MVMVRRRTMMIIQHRMNKRSTRTVEPQEAAIETFVRNSTKKATNIKKMEKVNSQEQENQAEAPLGWPQQFDAERCEPLQIPGGTQWKSYLLMSRTES